MSFLLPPSTSKLKHATQAKRGQYAKAEEEEERSDSEEHERSNAGSLCGSEAELVCHQRDESVHSQASQEIALLGDLCIMERKHCAGSFLTVPNKPTQRTAQQAIVTVLLLKKTLQLLPELEAVLNHCEGDLLKTIAQNLRAASVGLIKQEIDKILEDDANISKKRSEHMRTQMVFAVKSGINGLLDVARATYCEVIEEIHAEVEKYKTACDCPNIRLAFNPSRGYHLSVPDMVLRMDNQPVTFIQQVKRGKVVLCTTENLASLDDRQAEAFAEINIMTERVVQDLLTLIRQHMGWLFNISESLAFLDMMHAFANLVPQRKLRTPRVHGGRADRHQAEAAPDHGSATQRRVRGERLLPHGSQQPPTDHGTKQFRQVDLFAANWCANHHGTSGLLRPCTIRVLSHRRSTVHAYELC